MDEGKFFARIPSIYSAKNQLKVALRDIADIRNKPRCKAEKSTKRRKR
jgi:hypothetical protein